MAGDLVHILPTALDLLALATCLGVLSGRLWVLPPSATTADAPHAALLLTPLWQRLVVCIALLTVSSIGELMGRAVSMSGRPLSAIFPVLSTVLFRTHYGRVWLIRPVALAGLWVGWGVGRRRVYARALPTLMVGAWMLIALTVVVLPVTIKWPDQRKALIADIARRFSTLASVALAGVLLTGMYNAWLEVGTFRALWATRYGWTLLAKPLLVLPLLALGASNRYLSVPRLQGWAGRPVPTRWRLPILPVRRDLAAGRRSPWGIQLVRQWVRKVGAEASLVVGVFICTALLLYGVPARHVSHLEHGHSQETPASEPVDAHVGVHIIKAPPHDGRKDHAEAITRGEPLWQWRPPRLYRDLAWRTRGGPPGWP